MVAAWIIYVRVLHLLDYHGLSTCRWYWNVLKHQHLGYLWVNYNISLTWIKAILGWFPLLTMIIVRSQWGRYNLLRYLGCLINLDICTGQLAVGSPGITCRCKAMGFESGVSMNIFNKNPEDIIYVQYTPIFSIFSWDLKIYLQYTPSKKPSSKCTYQWTIHRSFPTVKPGDFPSLVNCPSEPRFGPGQVEIKMEIHGDR